MLYNLVHGGALGGLTREECWAWVVQLRCSYAGVFWGPSA